MGRSECGGNAGSIFFAFWVCRNSERSARFVHARVKLLLWIWVSINHRQPEQFVEMVVFGNLGCNTFVLHSPSIAKHGENFTRTLSLRGSTKVLIYLRT